MWFLHCLIKHKQLIVPQTCTQEARLKNYPFGMRKNKTVLLLENYFIN